MLSRQANQLFHFHICRIQIGVEAGGKDRYQTQAMYKAIYIANSQNNNNMVGLVKISKSLSC